jgi:hypothetical protein
MTQATDHLRATLDLHFDPVWGAPWWLEQRDALPFDPRREITTIADLERFPPFPLEELSRRPVTHFIPRRFHDKLAAFVTSETGGATGTPRTTAYSTDDFHAAFVAPFVAGAALFDFPRGGQWLFVGPSGPHVIGKAARACAAALGALDPFMVDFDPRWVRKLPVGSLARTRYLDHVVEQALRIVLVQEVNVLFTTPPVLEVLGERMETDVRERVTGIHLGGMAPGPGFRERLRERFPRAVSLSGYGNSLAGVCPEVTPGAGEVYCYAAHGPRLHLGIEREVGADRGRVRFHRLDEACFLPHVVEGDEAELAPELPSLSADAGFHGPGLVNPGPAAHLATTRQEGLY